MEIRKAAHAIVIEYQKKDDSRSSELAKSSRNGIASAKDSFKKSEIDATTSKIEKERDAAVVNFVGSCAAAAVTFGMGAAASSGGAVAAVGDIVTSFTGVGAVAGTAFAAASGATTETAGSSESKARQSDNKKEGKRTTSLFLIA